MSEHPRELLFRGNVQVMECPHLAFGKVKTALITGIADQDGCYLAEVVAHDTEVARKEAIFRLKGFKVFGLMETAPSNSSVAPSAGGQG